MSWSNRFGIFGACILLSFSTIGNGWEFEVLDYRFGASRIGTNSFINLVKDFQMSLFRTAITAVDLMVPFGLAQATTNITPPPEFN